MKIGIIGGGASGFFTAINIKLKNPNYEVFIYEKTSKILTKVKVSGGGRCNVTNGENTYNIFTENYPRGKKYFKNLYKNFNNTDIITWFSKHGVSCKIEPDGRVFPKSNDSQTVIDCFIRLCKELDVRIVTGANCTGVKRINQRLSLTINTQEEVSLDKVVFCVGGANNTAHYNMIRALGHHIIDPVPSLFTFNLTDKKITHLMGVSAKNVLLKILNTNYENSGDLLITHWGLSGPGVIKLSAFAAQKLHEMGYIYDVKVNWVGIKNEDIVREALINFKKNNLQKTVLKYPQFDLPSRLWEYLCAESEVGEHIKWSEISSKAFNKLVDALTNSIYNAKGKTTFKEEFVACGGVDLDEINPKTMESKLVSGIYFAGEVVNIDGVTGGFNFQNAWTTGYVVAQNI